LERKILKAKGWEGKVEKGRQKVREREGKTFKNHLYALAPIKAGSRSYNVTDDPFVTFNN